MTIEIKGQKIYVEEILKILCKRGDKFPIKIVYEDKIFYIHQGTKTGGLYMNAQEK